VLFVAVAASAVAMWRGVYAVLFVQPAFETRVLVFGAGAAGTALARAMNRPGGTSSINPYHGTGYRIIGFVDDDPDKMLKAQALGAPVLGGSGDLPRLARELKPDQVVLAITHRNTIRQEAFDALMACREQGFHVTTMQAVYERMLGRVPVDHIGRNITAVLPEDDRGPGERLYVLGKRAVDFIVASLALVLLAMVVPLVALLNLLGNRGPLFYRQVRVGQGGRPFSVYKFRTMVMDAEKGTGAVWAQAHDPRVTPVGRLLRRARIDELPQVLNVLRGEMSLIGPRPERPEFVEALAQAIPFYKARHAVRPGLTGWAQVRYGYGNTVEDARVKLEYDLYYVRQAGFYLDALILLKTAAVVFRLQGK
jgi:exopolysaccharide biosynthesis polyprenyl glycosylphosphotransferase